MFKKIIGLFFVITLIVTNYLPISAKESNVSKQPNRIEKIDIDGKEYTYSFFFENNISTVIVDNGVKIDIVVYDKVKNLMTLNGKKFGEIQNFDMSAGSFNLISIAATQRCGFDEVTLYDEAGNLAVYEGCSTVAYYKGSQAASALAATAIFMMFDLAGLKNSYLSHIGTTVLPALLPQSYTVARQQYRSKYTMLFPYNGTYKYKHIYNSACIENGTKWITTLSVWWF